MPRTCYINPPISPRESNRSLELCHSLTIPPHQVQIGFNPQLQEPYLGLDLIRDERHPQIPNFRTPKVS